MPDINPSVPVVGQPDSSEEPKIVTALTQLIAAVNNVDTDQIADGTIQAADLGSPLAALLGVDAGGSKRRGKCIIPTQESTTSTTYTTLPTPDVIEGLVLPSDGLIFYGINHEILSTGDVSQAGLFLNDVQVKQPAAAALTGVEQFFGGSVANHWQYLSSSTQGLFVISVAIDTDPVTTGMLLAGYSGGAANPGGVGAIFAAAGTYDLAVKYKSTGGVTAFAKNRKMWAWTMGF